MAESPNPVGRRMTAIEKAEVLEIVKIAAGSHKEYINFDVMLREHFLWEDAVLTQLKEPER